MKHKPGPQLLLSLYAQPPPPPHTSSSAMLHYSVHWQLTWIGQWMYLTIHIHYMEVHEDRESLQYTYMMHYTHAILSRHTGRLTEKEHSYTLKWNTHTHFGTHTRFIEIQYPGDALQSLVCLCRAQWILRQMRCFSQTKTFSRLLTQVYTYLWKTTNVHIMYYRKWCPCFLYSNITRELHFHVKTTELPPNHLLSEIKTFVIC